MICAVIDLLCSVNENSSILTRLIIFGQDFYSHSNWVELGHRRIHPHLLKPGREIKSIAEGNGLLVFSQIFLVSAFRPSRQVTAVELVNSNTKSGFKKKRNGDTSFYRFTTEKIAITHSITSEGSLRIHGFI